MNTVKLGTLENIAIRALALNEFNHHELVDEIESQDYMCMNPDFADSTELAEAIINHKDEELDWEYEWDPDCFYYVWSKIDGKDIGFILWSDDIAAIVDEEFDYELSAGDEQWDERFMELLKNEIEN